jgi:hypothetical protein
VQSNKKTKSLSNYQHQTIVNLGRIFDVELTWLVIKKCYTKKAPFIGAY